MIKVNYFYRNQNLGHSIEKVFNVLVEELAKNVKAVKFLMPSSRSLPLDFIKNGYYTFQNRNRNGINHITGHIHEVVFGLIGCKSVITIHDLVFLDNVKNPFKRFYKWLFWLYFPVKLADRVVCISTQTKNNILKYINAKNLTVIYNPIDPKIVFSPKEFNKEKPVILHIGAGWNKNLENTILALYGISCHLRIIGKIDKNIQQLLVDKNIVYSYAQNLSDEEIIEEYKNCDIVSFPSIYEGFGMPIIEGQAKGRVVLTSNIEPMIEVGANAAHYVNPNDVQSIKSGFIKIIENDNYRSQLIENGLENIKRFQVEEIAMQYMELYKTLI